MSPPTPPPQKRYTVHWVMLGVLMIAWAGWVAFQARSARPPWRQATSPAGVEWFLMVRVPEVPSDASETAAAQKRVAAWIQALRRAGFQPMLLTSVLARLDRGQPLPRKTVVLLFQPGYRHTYETLAPILTQQQCPAVWLADTTAIGQADRRYLSRHALDQMRRSGWWDVGWYEGPLQQEAVVVELPTSRTQRWPTRRITLAMRTSHTALNMASDRGTLHRLAARPPWTAQELVDRLSAEVPIDRPAYLTVRRIGQRLWGLPIDAEAAEERQPFRLQAPLHQRVASVAWPCTSGHNDVLLEAHLLKRRGHTWVVLRSNPSIGQGLRVGFTEEAILVEQDHHGTRSQLAAAPWPAVDQARVTAVLLLRGQRLQVFIEDQPVLAVDTLQPPTDPHGVVELIAYDRVHGAAGVKTASLTLIPLHEVRHAYAKTP